MTRHLITKIVVFVFVLWSFQAHAFHAETTHAGITEAAAYGSGLHTWLQKQMSAEKGLWETLSFRPKSVSRIRRWVLVQDFFRLNPYHGYAPNRKLQNRALGWLLAGSVLEATPSVRIRNHFFDPKTEKGLQQKKGRKGYSAKIRIWDYLYGGGSIAGMLTGANFDLTGKSALSWALDKSNGYSLWAYLKHRYLAQTAKTPAKRKHHLSMALLTMGALSHLLQKMACPSYVKNDFITSHLVKGSIPGGTPFARYAARRYGRSAIASVKRTVPYFKKFRHFFKNSKGTGLAQLTAQNYFSPGSLPKAQSPVRDSLFKDIKPGQSYYFYRKNTRPGFQPIRLFAYGISPSGKKYLWLDRRVYADYARELLPRAVSYTQGLFKFLLRGSLSVDKLGNTLAVINRGVTLKKGHIELFAQNKNGTRSRILRKKVTKKAPAKKLLATFTLSKLPKGTKAVIAVFRGQDESKQPLVCEGIWSSL